MKFFSCAVLLALLRDVCLSINVTVSPSPLAVVQSGDNVTLSCVVSQRRRSSALPVIRWTFLPGHAHLNEADAHLNELLVVRVNMHKARFYGNYTKSFHWPKLTLTVVKQGKVFDLTIVNVSPGDSGLYMCRVTEFKRYQDRWKVFSNCSAATELRVHVIPVTKVKEVNLWSLFEDVYVCALCVCCVGLVCMLIFSVTVTCQYLTNRKHSLKDRYHLVQTPQNRTVGGAIGSLTQKQRKYQKKRKHQEDKPPDIPDKAPISDEVPKPKLLKPQPKKVILPRILEEPLSLTYAELELFKLPECQAASSGTVYAQILFEEGPV